MTTQTPSSRPEQTEPKDKIDPADGPLWYQTSNYKLILNKLGFFVKAHWQTLLVVISLMTTALIIFLNWSGIIAALRTLVLSLFILGGVILGGYAGLALLIALLSIPFIIVLIFHGAFQHPKALNTIRTGRAVLATGFIVVLGGLYADALEASFAYGALNLRPEIVRGYSWVAIALLLLAYMRALYGEGLSAYRARGQHKSEAKWGLLLRPAFVLSAFVFDLLVPVTVSLSVLINFRCSGYFLIFEVWSWILLQFEFLSPLISYFSGLIAQTEFATLALQWLSEKYRATIDMAAASELIVGVVGTIKSSAFWEAISLTFKGSECNYLPI